jgi:hypothetical protein
MSFESLGIRNEPKYDKAKECKIYWSNTAFETRALIEGNT